MLATTFPWSGNRLHSSKYGLSRRWCNSEKGESPQDFLNFRNNLVMLYKNLSDEELNKVMRIRTCLDYVAAFTFLLKGQLDNARAVMRARKEYKQICPSFSSSRKENLRKTSLNQS